LPEPKPTKMTEPEIKNEATEPQTATDPSENLQQNRRRRSRSRHLEPSVNMDELRELIQLINENDFSEFEMEREGFRVRFRRGVEISETSSAGFSQSRELTASSVAATGEQAVSVLPSHPGAKAQTEASEDQDLYIIPSPIVGTFYRAASPNADAFVKIGSRVEPETVVCIIEAMKLMNEIQAETTGEVAKIYVENGQPVEYGQPLYGIKK